MILYYFINLRFKIFGNRKLNKYKNLSKFKLLHNKNKINSLK